MDMRLDPIDTWIKRGASEVFSVTTMVSPEMAARLLERNSDNRPVRWKGATRCVEAYAKAMQRGEWMLNGEAIIVASDGNLNDGQHRLNAVVAAQVPVPMVVQFGVERDSRHTLDQGIARTPGHILAMQGERSTNQLASALHFLWCYETDQSFHNRFTPEQMINVLDAHPGLRDFISFGARLGGEFRVSSGYMAGAAYVCSLVNAEVTQELLEAAIDGLNLHEGSPVILLRKRFQGHVSKRDRLTNIEQTALFIKVFNALLHRRSMVNLRWRQNGPESFPVAGA